MDLIYAFRMDSLQTGLSEAFTEIDLAVNSARRSQIGIVFSNQLSRFDSCLENA